MKNKIGMIILLYSAVSAAAGVVNMNQITTQDIKSISGTGQTGLFNNPNAVMNPFVPPPPPLPAAPSGASSAEDAAAAAEIQSEISQSSELAGSNIMVTVQQGAVTLDGSTDTMAKVSEAEKIAGSVPGVKSVSSRITIK